jgi:hypothetical protein
VRCSIASSVAPVPTPAATSASSEAQIPFCRTATGAEKTAGARIAVPSFLAGHWTGAVRRIRLSELGHCRKCLYLILVAAACLCRAAAPGPRLPRCRTGQRSPPVALRPAAGRLRRRSHEQANGNTAIRAISSVISKQSRHSYRGDSFEKTRRGATRFNGAYGTPKFGTPSLHYWRRLPSACSATSPAPAQAAKSGHLPAMSHKSEMSVELLLVIRM